jgi:CRP-like cAMP-binding protein
VPILNQAKKFTFKELCEYLIYHNRSIIHDEYYEKALEAVHFLLPEAIRVSKKNVQSLNTDKLTEILSGGLITKTQKKLGHFPKFENLDKKNRFESISTDEDEISRFFELTTLNEVSTLSEGVGFGELALINNAPRSATIVTTTECYFATLEKKSFKEIMGKIYKKKFTKLTRLMEHFLIFDEVNEFDKEKM